MTEMNDNDVQQSDANFERRHGEQHAVDNKQTPKARHLGLVLNPGAVASLTLTRRWTVINSEFVKRVPVSVHRRPLLSSPIHEGSRSAT
jgi:hypothetical protein